MCNRNLLWKNGETLTVGFLATAQCTNQNITPDARLRAAVKKCAPVWEPFANIKFKFLEDHEATSADIRIEMTRLPKTSYSAVGRQARLMRGVQDGGSVFLQGSQDDAELSLNDAELSRVIMHEFGHVLGAEHEHQRPDTGITWDEDGVFKDYNNRGRETSNVKEDVFDVNSQESLAEEMST